MAQTSYKLSYCYVFPEKDIIHIYYIYTMVTLVFCLYVCVCVCACVRVCVCTCVYVCVRVCSSVGRCVFIVLCIDLHEVCGLSLSVSLFVCLCACALIQGIIYIHLVEAYK